jgi:hypothetical protein
MVRRQLGFTRSAGRHVHRDFEAETQIGGGRGLPCHAGVSF